MNEQKNQYHKIFAKCTKCDAITIFWHDKHIDFDEKVKKEHSCQNCGKFKLVGWSEKYAQENYLTFGEDESK